MEIDSIVLSNLVANQSHLFSHASHGLCARPIPESPVSTPSIGQPTDFPCDPVLHLL